MLNLNNNLFDYAKELSLLNILKDSKKITEEEYLELLASIQRDYKISPLVSKST